ncbi:MAG TPA: GDSL-type esterase/lipase family protein, partial [Kiritimatiellia bacterium]|nr:GDSL-type esterase/lipase family protein [Kiritimatiellia bacterium]
MHKRWFWAALLAATWSAWGVSESQAQGPVLCMGDSITQGRAEFVSVSYPIRLYRNTGAPTINAGVGGVTASYSLRVIDSLLAQHHPSYVLLMYGTNDINDPGKNLQSVAYVVLQAALRAQASGAIPVIGTIPPMVGPRAGDMSKVRSYNSYLRSYAAAYGIRLADIQAAFGSGAGLFVSDGFHPNDAGMEIIARTFGAHIPVLVLAPTSRAHSEEAAAGQSFTVTTALPWTVGGNPPWIAIQSAAAGEGNGTVVYDVEENLGPARSGKITVKGGGIDRPFTVSQAASPSLKIECAYGTPNPAVGTVWARRNTATNASVAGSPIALGVGTQLACVGWTATGSAPKSGTTTNTGPFVLTNATTVTWQWRTNVWLETAASEGGAVSVASGWFIKGSNVAVRALPAAGFKFVKWSGASASTAEAITIGMTSAKSLAAEFAIATNYLATSSRYGVPEPAGTNWMRKDTTTSAGLAGSPIALGGATQLVCVGWTATGSAPKTGAATNTGSFVLTNNTTIVWQWRTNVWLATAAGEGGAVSVASGWQGLGSNVPVRALPAAGFKFVKWSGASASTAEAITVGMTSTKSLAAEFAIATNSLATASRYGVPEPAGTNWMRKDTTTNAGVAGSPIALGVSTQLACVGWTATGSAPKTGAATNTGPFVLTNNTTIVWQWRTNVWLETTSIGNGSVGPASGWFGLGTPVALRATPAAGSRFFRWTGAASGTSSNASVAMTSAKAVTAWFGVDVTVQARGLDGSSKGVAVRTTPADVFQLATGTTPRKFSYTNGTVVGLSAPEALPGGWKLVGWTGVDSWNGTNAIWTANASNVVTALYDPPPVVAITNPTTRATWTTTNRTLNLKGRAAAVGGLVRVEASNARAERDRLCAGTANWSCDGLTLYPGSNLITVTAYDAKANAAT